MHTLVLSACWKSLNILLEQSIPDLVFSFFNRDPVFKTVISAVCLGVLSQHADGRLAVAEARGLRHGGCQRRDADAGEVGSGPGDRVGRGHLQRWSEVLLPGGFSDHVLDGAPGGG